MLLFLYFKSQKHVHLQELIFKNDILWNSSCT